MKSFFTNSKLLLSFSLFTFSVTILLFMISFLINSNKSVIASDNTNAKLISDIRNNDISIYDKSYSIVAPVVKDNEICIVLKEEFKFPPRFCYIKVTEVIDLDK